MRARSTKRMRVIVLCVLCGVVIATSAGAGLTQPAVNFLSEAKRLLSEQKFFEAYELLKSIRASPWGRSLETDYMLGASACRLADRRDRGRAFLTWVRKTYAPQLTA